MNVGVNFLREHMPDQCRIHYSITDGGGASPNVVQPHAQVLYMVRSGNTKSALELQARVDKIAQGAALMTETKLKKQFIDGCGDIVPNVTLEKVLAKNFDEVGAPKFDEKEMQLAKELTESYELRGSLMPKIAEKMSPENKAYVEKSDIVLNCSAYKESKAVKKLLKAINKFFKKVTKEKGRA